jgi:hypothetical protein
MGSGFEMRVGHAERDAVATELREHYATGRLTLDELNERLDKAFAAKTKGDLNAIMTDLPSAGGSGSGMGASTGFGATGAGTTAGIGTGWGAGSGAGAGAGAGRSRAGQTVAGVLVGLVMVAALLTLGCLTLFGAGGGKPFGIVIILAALAFLRRVIFGRRQQARGPRSRRRW